MFGLVKRSRLLECEKSRVDLRVKAIRHRKRAEEAEQKLALLEAEHASLTARLEACEAERQQLLEALFAKARGGEAQEQTSAPRGGEREEPAGPRMLTGFEVVSRAMNHRAVHNQAARRISARPPATPYTAGTGA